jgi:hypothetical protein
MQAAEERIGAAERKLADRPCRLQPVVDRDVRPTLSQDRVKHARGERADRRIRSGTERSGGNVPVSRGIAERRYIGAIFYISHTCGAASITRFVHNPVCRLLYAASATNNGKQMLNRWLGIVNSMQHCGVNLAGCIVEMRELRRRRSTTCFYGRCYKPEDRTRPASKTK